MTATRLHALTTDVVALEAVVRALVRVETRRSRAAGAELLEALSEESDRLSAGSIPGDPDVAAILDGLQTWIDELKSDVLDAPRPTLTSA
ncbi:hypothetical protein [Brevundimonas sp. Root1279]|uniref:hypothetical protein n=1 Tax=Brevundimonas sp. Root1279 TaxID=1736443 RepID=UPI0006FDB8CB|nr:hypothetical protein [Brevundimonas sp. Root1279]KQW82228.1 hypothetical protein ASC65_08080 [Brevundimonas sp. Root1279]